MKIVVSDKYKSIETIFKLIIFDSPPKVFNTNIEEVSIHVGSPLYY